MDNKIIVITGGSSGIGKATAIQYLKENNIVYITGRDLNKLQKVQRELSNSKGEIHILDFDVSKPMECKKALETIAMEQGRIDILVNSAGVCYTGSTESMTEQIFDETINTNLKGTYFMCQYAIPYLKLSHGNIVNLSSDAGLVGNQGLAIYCASKGGVTLLTKSLAVELALDGIRVNAVCPGEVDTPMLDIDFQHSIYDSREEFDQAYLTGYPQGDQARYVKAKEVAQCIYFLSDTSKVEAITGACLSVDFGITAGY